MLESVARGVYRRPATQYVLDRFDLDRSVRRYYSRLREKVRGTTTLSVAGTTVEVSQSAIPDATYLDPELTVLERLLDRLEPGDVFWDVGADKGLYSCLVAATGCDSVIAFEPHPVRREALIRNLRRNDLSGRVRLEALSDRNGNAPFHYRIEGWNAVDATTASATDDGATADGREERAGPTRSGTFTATLARGDTLVNAGDVPPPTVIKVDVEGAEFEALQGLEETLSRPSCRLVYCELHDAESRGFTGGPDRVRRYLEELGFAVSTVTTRSEEDWTQPYIEASREETEDMATKAREQTRSSTETDGA